MYQVSFEVIRDEIAEILSSIVQHIRLAGEVKIGIENRQGVAALAVVQKISCTGLRQHWLTASCLRYTPRPWL